jgi:hypothetical protein
VRELVLAALETAARPLDSLNLASLIDRKEMIVVQALGAAGVRGPGGLEPDAGRAAAVQVQLGAERRGGGVVIERTDWKHRAEVAEARVAILEDELAAWRDRDRRAFEDDERRTREEALVATLRRIRLDITNTPQCARLLLMKPAGAGSVMADRARGAVEGDSAQVALWRRLELLPDAAVGGAGGRGADQRHRSPARPAPPGWTCWEPACGPGHMAHGLAPYFRTVRCTDIHDHGGEGPALHLRLPGCGGDAYEPVDWIVTNPPFAKAAEFVAAGLRRARRGVAILARVTLLRERHPVRDVLRGAAAALRLRPVLRARADDPGRLGPEGQHRHRLRLVRVDAARPPRPT